MSYSRIFKAAITRASLPVLFAAAALILPTAISAQTAGSSDLSITKIAAEDPIPSGSVQTYTIVVTNNGPDASFGTVVDDSLPSGATFVSASTTGAVDPAAATVQAGGVINSFLGTMEPGTSATLTIQATVNGNGKNINTATVRKAGGCDPDPTNNFASVQVTQSAGGSGPGANLEITKVDLQDPIEVGALLTYNIVVTNHGPADAADVVITEKLPTGSDFVSATSSNTLGFVEANGIVTYLIGHLSNDETANVSVTIRPNFSGLIANAVSARSSTNQSGPLANNTVVEYTTITGAPVCSCCAVTPEAVDLAITKTDAPDPVIVGQPLTYTINVANVGTTSATGVLVTDVLPEGVTPVSEVAVPTGVCSRNGRTITCNLGTLLPSASSVITVVVIPTETGNLSNTAVVRSNESDANTANNVTSSVQTQVFPMVEAIADLNITKTARAQTTLVGQNVTYDITVNNPGAIAADGVIVTDTLQDSVSFVSATPSQGVCLRDGSTLTCHLGTVAPNSSQNIVLEVTPNVAGLLQNSVTVRSNSTDPDQANNTSTAVINVAAGTGCADLTGMFKMPPFNDCATNKKGKVSCDLRSWFVLQNFGDQVIKKVSVDFYLSEDTIFDSGDKKLKTLNFKAVNPGAMLQVDPHFKKQQNPVGKYVIAVIDQKNKIAECSEDNNIIVSPAALGPQE